MGWFRRWFVDAKNTHLVQGAHYHDHFAAKLGLRKLETRRVLSVSAGLNLAELNLQMDGNEQVFSRSDESSTPTSAWGESGPVAASDGRTAPPPAAQLTRVDMSGVSGNGGSIVTPARDAGLDRSHINQAAADGLRDGIETAPIVDASQLLDRIAAVGRESGALDGNGEGLVDAVVTPDMATDSPITQEKLPPSGGNDSSASDDVTSSDESTNASGERELPTNYPSRDFEFPLIPPPPVDPPPGLLPVPRSSAGPELPVAQIIRVNSINDEEFGSLRSVMLDETNTDIAEIARVEFGLVDEDFAEWQDQAALMEVMEWDPDSPDFVAEIKDRILNNIRQEASKPDWVPGNYMIRRFDKSGVEVDLITFRKVQLTEEFESDLPREAGYDVKSEDALIFGSASQPIESASQSAASSTSQVVAWRAWHHEQQAVENRGGEPELKVQPVQARESESGVPTKSNVSQAEASRLNGLFMTSLSVAANPTKQRQPEAVHEAFVRHGKSNPFPQLSAAVLTGVSQLSRVLYNREDDDRGLRRRHSQGNRRSAWRHRSANSSQPGSRCVLRRVLAVGGHSDLC